MKFKKSITLLLVLSMLLSSMAACGSIETAETIAETAAAETVPEETGPVAELPDKTYNGEEVMFLTSHNSGYDWYSSYEIYAAEMTGELINDAVFQRNNEIEELLDIKIAETKLENCHTTASSSIVAGDKQFDVVMPYMNSTITLAVQGSLLDLKQIP
jgi:curli biogenesis system outer membrane secretion channel CsgG